MHAYFCHAVIVVFLQMLSVSPCETQPMVWLQQQVMTLVLGLGTGATLATCLWETRQECVRPTDIGLDKTQNADVRM